MTSAEEQETTLNFTRFEKEMKVYTCDGTMITYIEKQGWTHYKEDGDGRFYTIPVNALSIRSKSSLGKAKRILTDEQRKAIGERLRSAKSSPEGAEHPAEPNAEATAIDA